MHSKPSHLSLFILIAKLCNTRLTAGLFSGGGFAATARFGVGTSEERTHVRSWETKDWGSSAAHGDRTTADWADNSCYFGLRTYQTAEQVTAGVHAFWQRRQVAGTHFVYK